MSDEYFIRCEERVPNQFPILTKQKKFFTFLHNFELYFNDHYALRDFLIKTNNSIDYFVFNISPHENRVVVGKNQWLFLGDQFNNAFSNHSLTSPKNKKNAISFLRCEKYKMNFLERRGIKYLFVIAPDKASIYPEYLPDYVLHPNSAMVSDLLKSLSYNSGINLLDLREILIAKKDVYNDIIYPKTDTHWTDLGAYFAYEEIVHTLEKNFGPLKLFDIDGYTVKVRGGFDLGRFLNIYFPVKDFKVQINSTFQPITILDDNNNTISSNPHTRMIRDYNAVKNPNALNDLSGLIVHDSFFAAISPFFNQTFKECTYTYHSSIFTKDNISDIIYHLKPDFFIFEIVERYLISSGINYPELQSTTITQLEAHNLWPILPAKLNSFNAQYWENEISEIRDNGKIKAEPNNLLHVNSFAKDFYFTIPINTVMPSDILILLEVDSPIKTPFSLYFLGINDTKFSEYKKIKTNLKKGKNKVFLEYSNSDKIIKIRLYPGPHPGNFVLRNFEIKPFPSNSLKRLYGNL